MNENLVSFDPQRRKFRPDSELTREELYEREKNRRDKRAERARNAAKPSPQRKPKQPPLSKPTRIRNGPIHANSATKPLLAFG